MNSMMLDDCLQNLFYAQEAMKEWIPMTEYEVIFEAAEKSDVADKVAKNEETASKTVGFVKKAIDAVIDMIKKVYYAIKEFINRCTMSGDERKAFDEFKEAIRLDPSLKNKKVTVQDFRKINAQYDDLINEIDKNIRAVKANEKHPIDNLVKKVTDFTKGTVTAASVIVAADAAIKMADSNVEVAKMIRNALKTEEGVMESLSKALGKKDALKFQKEIDAAAKNTILHRLKVKLYRNKYNDLSSAIKGTINTLTHAGFRNVGEIKQDKKDLKSEKKSGNISKEEYKEKKKALDKEEKIAKHEALSSLSMDKKFLKNEYTGSIIKTVTKAAVDAKVDLTKEELSDKIDEFIKNKFTDKDHAKRNKDDVYKSAFNFFSGLK